LPCSESGLTVVGMNGANPSLSARFILCKAGEGFPPVAGVTDHSVGVRGPGHFGTEFYRIAVVVFAFGERFFGAFAACDIDQSDGDADDLIGLITGGLIGDEEGSHEAGLMGSGAPCFEFAEALAVE